MWSALNASRARPEKKVAMNIKKPESAEMRKAKKFACLVFVSSMAAISVARAGLQMTTFFLSCPVP